MSGSGQLAQRIQERFDSLSKGKKRLAKFILDRWDEAAFCNATELGEKVDLSQSVVVRFASDLGYPGYPELQKALQERLRQRVTTVDRFRRLTDDFSQEQELIEEIWQRDLENIEQTIQANPMDVLKETVKIMLAADKIYIVSTSATAALGLLLAHNLNMILGDTWFLSSQTGQMFDRIRRMRETDLIIGISFPRYSSLTYKAMKLAKHGNARSVAVTDSLVAPIAQLAESVLTVKTESVSFARSHVAGVSLANTLFAILGIQAKERVGRALEGFESDRRFWTEEDEDVWNEAVVDGDPEDTAWT